MTNQPSSLPREFHFIFGLRPQTEPLHLVHYLCLESCRQVNSPAAINFYYRHEPHGPWWERIRPHLQLHYLGDHASYIDHARYQNTDEGRFIARAGWSYAHEADFLRLEILLEKGGVYADIDTLFVKPYPHEFYAHEFVIGEETSLPGDDGVRRPSLCNAVMFSRPNARFARAWLERMAETFDGTWSKHSCQLASLLWQENPVHAHVLPPRFFYRFFWDQAGLQSLLEGKDADLRDVYSIHLWEHLWWDQWRTDFSHVHAGMLTEEYMRTVDTTYNLLARPFLPRETDVK